MSKIYFTITGMNYYHGTDVVEKGDEVKLVKYLNVMLPYLCEYYDLPVGA